jgi:hypothetical protein
LAASQGNTTLAVMGMIEDLAKWWRKAASTSN